jgi:hypothetical protein
VGDDDHGHPLVGEFFHDGEHLARHLGIERAGGLVEEHQRWPHGQRAGDRDSLLLTARELARVAVPLVG